MPMKLLRELAADKLPRTLTYPPDLDKLRVLHAAGMVIALLPRSSSEDPELQAVTAVGTCLFIPPKGRIAAATGVWPSEGDIPALAPSSWEDDMAYTVTLIGYTAPQGFPDIADDAVDRFMTMLERHLGNRTIQALKAHRCSREVPAIQLRDEEYRLAQEWAIAYAAAKDAGLHGLPRTTSTAWFDVQLS